MTVTSPCTGICKLDAATGWCVGCGRTGDELAGWQSKSEAWRKAIWIEIPDRLDRLGVACRRLSWTTGDIRRFAAQSLSEGRGTWVMGVVGAVAGFTAAPGMPVDVTEHGDDLVAYTANGALRMKIDDDVRALTFEPPYSDAPPRIVLAVKRERGRLPVAPGVTDGGNDGAALIAEPGARLFDLGLGRKDARFCVRVNRGAARRALDRAATLPFAAALPLIGQALIAESPVRVVDTALGRIEVEGQIPAPDARSPAGPHTHLLPDQLATGRALPAGMDLPRAYLPGAIFYPPK